MTYFCTRVYCVAYVEAATSIQKDPIEEVTLARSVHASHRNDPHRRVQAPQKLPRLLVNLKLYATNKTIVRMRIGEVKLTSDML